VETARFQLVAGLRTSGRLYPPWPIARPDGGQPDGVWFGWRLLSRNHRDLARSPAVHPTVESCLASIGLARRTVAAADTVLTRNVSTGRWTWVLIARGSASDVGRDDALVVANGSRGYMRRRECHDCVAQVVELARVARDPEPGAVTAPRGGAVRG
jgi:hypothetical protein